MAESIRSKKREKGSVNDGFLLLRERLEGEVYSDLARRIMYSTDASDYKEKPHAIVYPQHEGDIIELVRFAREKAVTLIPRAAGTSLAGQVVGNGIVVDVSRHMTKILEVNQKEQWVRVQPGVILDELNIYLRKYGLFFGPETSTSNRSMIGGMIGNNSCGLHSIVHGTARDHTISIRAVLSDASVSEFGPLNSDALEEKMKLESFEGVLYREFYGILSDKGNQEEIRDQFPDPKVVRRNTGYALDELLNCSHFLGSKAKYADFNLCKVLSGSEGTLLFMTEAKLNLMSLRPGYKVLIPVHFNSVMEAIRGNLAALQHNPTAVELMDKTILDCTRENLSQRKNRFFLKGDPGAILMVEIADDSESKLKDRVVSLEREMREEGHGYHFPVLSGNEISKVWTLRKAGLGVLSNMPGDGRPVSVIEDTSVNVEVLEDYIIEFNKLLETYSLECVYHAHISVGELHLRPVLNLKDPKDVKLFHDIALETAKLVKKYRGSLSGEHGDGRLRGEFIPLMVGEKNFELIRKVKRIFDPSGIFNKGKIVDTPPMNSNLRFDPGKAATPFRTFFDFSSEGGFMSLIEKCNGSGDCRKTEITGGTMCPSYMATRDESATTRARANVLRELLSSPDAKKPFDQREIYEVLDLCLSCKACKSECPSNVDMAKLKAEFMQHWYVHHPVPLRTWMIANISKINRVGMLFPLLFNATAKSKFTGRIFKMMLGIAPDRSIPALGKVTLRRWAKDHLDSLNKSLSPEAQEVVLYVDEFTNHNDCYLGIKTIQLFVRLGIRVQIVDHPVSARTYITKGLLKKARQYARRNIEILSDYISETRPLVGIEPSAILGFRDEFPDLVGADLASRAKAMSRHCFTVDEYLANAFNAGRIHRNLFSLETVHIKLHGHCQQKSISSTESSVDMLSIPENYTVEEIPSGCCGMAGSFGYEKEHYDLSMKVGELVLFPAVRETQSEIYIAASGTSCRHQIRDGTGINALHPVEILYNALV